MFDLTGFQRHCLYAIAILSDEQDGGPHGLAIKQFLEDEDYGEINHGRLYPNLDTLANMGLIDKSSRDKRTNEYHITARGRRDIADAAQRWCDALDAVDDDASGPTSQH